jgi:hypothetical protein
MRQAADLYLEVGQYIQQHSAPATHSEVEERALLEVTNRDRHCPDWYPYQAGLDPQAHLDQMQVIQLEEARYENQMVLAKVQADSQASLAAVTTTSQAIQKEIRDITEAAKSFTTRWTYVAVGIAAFALVAACAAVLFVALTYFRIKP